MIKKIKYILLILFLCLMTFPILKSNAATFALTASTKSASVGDKVTVTASINAAAWNVKISGAATDSIVGYNEDGKNESKTKTYTIDTSKEGTYKVSAIGDISDEVSDTTTKINESISIEVKAKETTTTKTEETSTKKEETTTQNTDTTTTKTATKSSNAYLKTLGVRPSEYDFTGFSKNKTEYSVTVPNSVDSLKVIATAAENGTVKITGNSGFETGSNNKIKIVVTSEDGKNTKEYTINVTKLAQEDEKLGNVIDETTETKTEDEIYLTELKINGITISPEFNKDIFSYTATSTKNESSVNITAKANTEDAKIEIAGNTELKVGENTINVMVSANDGSKQKVYQIVLTIDVEESLSSEGQSTGLVDSVLGNLKKYVIIAAIVVITIIVAIIILICMIVKENKKTDDDMMNEKTSRRSNTRSRH